MFKKIHVIINFLLNNIFLMCVTILIFDPSESNDRKKKSRKKRDLKNESFLYLFFAQKNLGISSVVLKQIFTMMDGAWRITNFIWYGKKKSSIKWKVLILQAKKQNFLETLFVSFSVSFSLKSILISSKSGNEFSKSAVIYIQFMSFWVNFENFLERCYWTWNRLKIILKMDFRKTLCDDQIRMHHKDVVFSGNNTVEGNLILFFGIK